MTIANKLTASFSKHGSGRWSVRVGIAAWIPLSGHTHHGQLAIPRLRWSVASLFQKYAMGAYREGESVLYVSPGRSFWRIPFRIGALPEVTVVTLHNDLAIP